MLGGLAKILNERGWRHELGRGEMKLSVLYELGAILCRRQSALVPSVASRALQRRKSLLIDYAAVRRDCERDVDYVDRTANADDTKDLRLAVARQISTRFGENDRGVRRRDGEQQQRRSEEADHGFSGSHSLSLPIHTPSTVKGISTFSTSHALALGGSPATK